MSPRACERRLRARALASVRPEVFEARIWCGGSGATIQRACALLRACAQALHNWTAVAMTSALGAPPRPRRLVARTAPRGVDVIAQPARPALHSRVAALRRSALRARRLSFAFVCCAVPRPLGRACAQRSSTCAFLRGFGPRTHWHAQLVSVAPRLQCFELGCLCAGSICCPIAFVASCLQVSVQLQ